MYGLFERCEIRKNQFIICTGQFRINWCFGKRYLIKIILFDWLKYLFSPAGSPALKKQK